MRHSICKTAQVVAKKTVSATARSKLKINAIGLIWFLLYMIAANVYGSTDQVHNFKIPASTLFEALTLLSEQSDTDVLFSYEMVEGKSSKVINGQYTIEGALEIILLDTGLTGGLSQKGVVTLNAVRLQINNIRGNSMNKKGLLATLIGGLFGVAGGTHAAALPGDSVNDRSSAIEEVIVTANKREQKFSDVGATMSVMGSETLKQRRITSMGDIANAVPSLSYARSDSNTPIYTLRGIGFNESSLGVYPAVSVYLDQAPLTFPTLASRSAFDLERIEVLKGPQGTLFGQNSTGGAINYVAAKPTPEFESGFDITYGRFSLLEFNGHVSGPLTDSLNGRIALQTHSMDPWQSSITRDDENGEGDYQAIRTMLDWSVSDDTQVLFTLSASNDESDPQALQLSALKIVPEGIDLPSILATPEGAVLNTVPLVPEENRKADWGPVDPFSDRDTWHASLKIAHEITDSIRFVSLSSYIEFEQEQASDRDGAYIQNEDLSFMEAEIETFTQEFRIEGTTSATDWVLGVTYEDSKVEENQLYQYLNNSRAIPAIRQNSIDLESDISNWAIFGNLEYHLSTELTAKVGVRYTDSEYEYSNCNHDSGDGGIAATFNYLGGLLGSVPFAPIGTGPGECFALNENDVPGSPYKNTLEEDNTSWRVGLDYRINDDVLVYGNLSKGYKQGSFPTSSPASISGFNPVVQESVLAYEIGTKAQFFENRLNINAAIFKYDYEDKQVRGVIADPVFNVIPQLRNVPKSEVTGAEFEIVAKTIQGLTVLINAVYLDTEITKAPEGAINAVGASAVGALDFEGANLPFTSRWSTSLDVEYEWFVGELSAFVGFNYTYQTEQSTVIDGESITVPAIPENRFITSNPFNVDEYGLLDMRAGLRGADDTWSLMVWGKNVTDEYYWNNVTVAQDTIGRAAGLPATYGVTFEYDF